MFQYRNLLFLILSLISFCLKSQDTLRLNKTEYEAIFLKENLLLLAEKLNIPKAEAAALQAKLWPNPTISIEDINLWATKRQVEIAGGGLPGFGGGKFGRNQEFSASIEQLMLTAGKRKKLMALEQVNIEQAKEYFEELLRNLKIEFINNLNKLQSLVATKNIYSNQLGAVQQLLQTYLKQANQGNIPKSDYVRLKALELEILKNINETGMQVNEVQKELKLLMHIPNDLYIEVPLAEDFRQNFEKVEGLSLESLIATAKENRPDFKISLLEQSYNEKLYAYQKSLRKPDLTVKGHYDRGGSIMYNFFGVGFQIDLPVFNRNQGNIKMAQLNIEQSKVLQNYKTLEIESEIKLNYLNLKNTLNFLKQIDPNYETTLDEMLHSYTKNFSSRNISLLEYLDFSDAYIANKLTILNLIKDFNERVEMLNYAVGFNVI